MLKANAYWMLTNGKTMPQSERTFLKNPQLIFKIAFSFHLPKENVDRKCVLPKLANKKLAPH